MGKENLKPTPSKGGTAKRSKTKRCATRYCKNDPVKKGNYCHSCYGRRYDEKNPGRRVYNNLKQHARSRGIDFSLTYEEFMQFAVKFNYLGKRGKEKHSLTIDRIDSEKGYSLDNIQPMTFSDNSSKKKVYIHDWVNKTGRYVNGYQSTDTTPNPF